MSKIKLRIRDMAILTLLVLAMALPGLGLFGPGLPVIDRDEARYAQATVQMLESGDYINIKFQDRARNKKPAGAYWAQAASVKMFSDTQNRNIWAHRIPSVLAAILAILATYWGGARMLGRDSALYGSALLAVSFIFVFEAHIAKTDALLLAFSALALASFGYLRNGGGRRSGMLFWFALGIAVMIKGPILPMLLVLCLVSLLVWERKAGWMKPLTYWPGPLLFLLIVLPWSVLIWQETSGAFFTEAIGNDLTPKLQGAQEKHSGPLGYYIGTIWLAFWPACLFLLPGLVFAIRAARSKKNGKTGFDTPVACSARLLLCWRIPFFLVLEIV
ncbi:MAG: glycosyltransferase family 39 protein, partial [Robiginitomaculum sp.]|nr:glycosyltransferase family 39 protein [Robiginitomaculum sp.]